MRVLQDRSAPNSDGYGLSEDRDTNALNSWQASSEDIRKQNYKLVLIANEKISLNSVLKRYQIVMQKINDNNWSHMGVCPFPMHNDVNASFGYNPSEDRFNCLGCKKSGRAVEFISFMEQRSRAEIAKEILESLNVSQDDIINFDGEIADSRSYDMLYEFSEYARNFILNNILW